jgi:hypothetical protein
MLLVRATFGNLNRGFVCSPPKILAVSGLKVRSVFYVLPRLPRPNKTQMQWADGAPKHEVTPRGTNIDTSELQSEGPKHVGWLQPQLPVYHLPRSTKCRIHPTSTNMAYLFGLPHHKVGGTKCQSPRGSEQTFHHFLHTPNPENSPSEA